MTVTTPSAISAAVTSTTGSTCTETTPLLAVTATTGSTSTGTSNESIDNNVNSITTQTTTGKVSIQNDNYDNKNGNIVSYISNIWSILIFDWFTPLLYKGNEQKVLHIHDLQLVPLPTDCTTNVVYTIFNTNWQKELLLQKTKSTKSKSSQSSNSNSNNNKYNNNNNNNTPSLINVLLKSFGKEFIYAGILKLIHDLCIFIGPQILKHMILYLRQSFTSYTTDVINTGVFLIVSVTLSQIIMSFCLRHYFFICYTIGLRIKTSLTIAIYTKALALNTTERSSNNNNHSIGQITNLMSIDIQRIQDLTTYINTIWSSPLQIIIAYYFLYKEIGISIIGGIVIILLMIPITKIVSGYMSTIQKNVMSSRDIRINYNNELLNGIKIIKYQSWEQSFYRNLQMLRTNELQQLFYYYINSSINESFWTLTPLAVAVTTFGIYTLVLHNTLDVSTALTSLTLFDILRFPLFVLPQIINDIIQAYISIQRVQSFLVCTGTDEYQSIPSINDNNNNTTDTNYDGTVVLNNVSVTYSNPNSTTTTFHNQNEIESTNSNAPTKDVDPLMKQLVESKWETSLLHAQLQEAESLLQKVTKEGLSVDDVDDDDIDNNNSNNSININNNQSNNNTNTSSILSLKRITIECIPGQFIVIVGNVGSGKSTIINTILGEVTIISGTVSVNGTIAYFSQSPFIMNASARDNILFSHSTFNITNTTNDTNNDNNTTINEELYQTAIECCSLNHDIQLLPYGDLTEIGERGITISGGQKARIALARCIYHNASITIIDDALSAVDAHVAKHIFDNAIINQLLHNKNNNNNNNNNNKQNSGGGSTVILVTNALQYLNHPRVDKIVVVQDGRIIEQGKYNDLVSNTDSVFARYISVIATNNDTSTDSLPITTTLNDKDISNETRDSTGTSSNPTVVDNDNDAIVKEMKKIVLPPTSEETRETGHVGYDVYMTWINAAGGIYVPILFVLSFVIVEGTTIAANWWLTYWSEHSNDNNDTDTDTTNREGSSNHYHSQVYFFTIYASIASFVVLAGLLSSILVSFFGLHASGKLFTGMIEAVLHARMSFFDTTPVGRLINRFSKDIYTTDERLTQTVTMYLATLFSVISTIVVITAVTPIFAICLIPMLSFYLTEQQFFTLTYRELKRLDSITRSPIYSLLGESIDGAAVIRAFGAQQTLLRRMVSILDTQQHAYFLTCTAQSWLAVRLELVGTLIITFACSSAVLQHLIFGANPRFAGLAGLAITYSLSVTQSLNWSVRMASDLEAEMVSVERIRDYSMLESEGARTTDVDKQLEGKWPTNGSIEFSGATLRYRPELPLVLKGLDIKIPGGSKVGVVGRTGAGKSTLMVSLMRIVELQDGKIFIDGIDTRTLGLSTLRRNIAVIPQDPILFSGTVRSNLDPFKTHADDVLLGVLERVGLYKAGLKKNDTSVSLTGLSTTNTTTRVDSLDNVVSEGGSNFSVGQRQLLVIARALLRGAKIIIMDEATASIDAETDSMIQKVLQTAFTNSTCITVAHRINTIMDSDYILVMDDGKAAEFDTPTNLLSKGSMFRDLVQAAKH